MALFKTITEIKDYLGGIQKNLDLATINSYVEEAELLYIEPFLGADLYSSLKAGYEGNTLSDSLQALLPLVQRPLAHFTFNQFAQFGNVFISDLGFQQVQSENSLPASQWAVNQVLNYTRETADKFLDRLIQFLEQNVGVYSTWQNSTYYQQSRELLLSNSRDFQKRYPIQNSALAFYHLRASIRLAEHKYIENTMSIAQLSDLKTKILNASLSSEETQAVNLAKDALAQFSIYEALPGLAVEVSPSSIRATVFSDAFKKIAPATLDIIEQLKCQAEMNGKAYLTELKKYLDSLPDSFPLYRDSGKYNPPPAVKSYEAIDNSDSSIFYMK